MLDEVMGFAKGLSACELRQAIEMLKVLVVQELRGPDEEPTSCPRCGCERIVRKGVQRVQGEDGQVSVTQRFLCK